MTTHNRRIVITGLGTINPLGSTVEEFWNNLCTGKSGTRKITNVNIGDYHVQIAAQTDIPDNIRDYFKQRKMVRRLDRYILFGQCAGAQAVRDAGLSEYRFPERIGVLIGTGDGGVGTHYQQINRIASHGMSSASPFYVSSSVPDTLSGVVSMETGFTGPNFAISSACASSNHAFGVACNMIACDMADVILTGGSEAPIVENSLAAFGQIGALSTRNDDPETASRPFDRDRDGFVIGEGASVLCLEELEHAKKRKAHIYAEIAGFGFTSDAYDLVAPHPEGIGAARAMQEALKMAQLNTGDIDLINCHGTSTQLGDLAEFAAVERTFGDLTPHIPVHSTKSMIGHLLGAASATEAIAGIMAFERNIIHPTTNQFNQDPAIGYNVVKETTERPINTFVSNSFGFGGHNACVIFKRFSE